MFFYVLVDNIDYNVLSLRWRCSTSTLQPCAPSTGARMCHTDTDGVKEAAGNEVNYGVKEAAGNEVNVTSFAKLFRPAPVRVSFLLVLK